MDLVAGVLLFPFLHPVQLAEELGTLDALSGGRLVVGVGQGYRDVEFEAFGVDRSRRLRVQLEHLDALLSWWDRPADHGPGLAMSPTRRPHPPVWYAAGAPRPYARAVGRGLVPFIGPQATPGEVETMIEQGDPAAEVALRRDVLVTDVVGRERAAQALAEQANRYAGWGYATPGRADVPYVVGDAGDCRAQLEAFGRGGVTQVVIRTNWPGISQAESLEMLAALLP